MFIGCQFPQQKEIKDFEDIDLDYRKLLAYNYTAEYLRDLSRLPASSIRFPHPDERKYHVDYLKNSMYRVTSWVNNPNSYGVMMKSPFVCDIFLNDSIVEVRRCNVDE